MKIQWVNKVQEGIPSWTCARDGHWQPEDIRKLGRKRSGKLQILLNGESGSMEDLRLEAREIVRELYRGAYEFSKKALKGVETGECLGDSAGGWRISETGSFSWFRIRI
ncbi:MAG: hypothetical protein ACLRT5_04865 [Lachnospiraceae bacterium]